ncbi:MAG TPA: aldo/keto reductase [Vicinamibacteria bacterium]|nr:aldo/keto reductase [Vicinamibacteria bacterium]
MEYRYLGRSGLKISRLAMGTMTFGGDADEAASRALFERCREAGINFFDCANVYAGGRAEEILGRLIAGCRREIVLSSKGAFPTGEDVNARGASRYNLVNAVEASLHRLRTDRIDVYFLHGFDPDTALEETLRALEDLVRQGKILHTAVSNFAAWQTVKVLGIQERHAWNRLVCVQPMYNLLKRQAEVEILPMAATEGLGVTTYNPLAAGLLTGKYGASRRPETGRLTSNQMYQARYGESAYIEIAEAFVALAREHGHHPAALAIAWVASHPAVTAAVMGARTLEQLDGCLGAADIEMTAELRDSISALSPAPPPATDRTEEAGPHRHAVR